jgi:hypothetical protein
MHLPHQFVGPLDLLSIEGALDAMNHYVTSSFGYDTKLVGGESLLKMNHKIESIGCD